MTDYSIGATSVPPALVIAFKRRTTLSAPELCKLLPMDPALLRKHMKHRNIEYDEVRRGGGAPSKAFTLVQVLDFLRLCTPRR